MRCALLAYGSLLLCMINYHNGFAKRADLESTRDAIITTLRHKNPDIVDEFHAFSRRYDEVVIRFFDKKNKDSLKTHIRYMEDDLALLTTVIQDKRFFTIHHFLVNRYGLIKELITLLKKYQHSSDALTLAFRLRRFKCLLPIEIKNRGDIALFWSLSHRLSCR